MNTNNFYGQLLGIEEPWLIENVELDMDEKRVDISVKYSAKTARCQCGKECKIHDRSDSRTWRHLDTCQMMTYIHCAVPRTKCDDCKVKTISAPWSSPHGRFTVLFEAMVIDWLLISRKQTKVAEQMNLSFDEVNAIMVRAVKRGLSKREEEVIKKLSIDEKSMKKGHHYLTVLSDPSKGIVLEVCETRTEDAVKEMLEIALTPTQRSEVDNISMDMWKSFMNAAEKLLPNADIVHDRFHISQYLGKAVDSTRKAENRRLSKEGIEDLKGSKYLLLRNFSNLLEKHQERFLKAIKSSDKTAAAWKYKELFRNFFDLKVIKEGKEFLDKWYDLAVAENIGPLTKAANTIKNHQDGILNYLKHKVTNAFAESLNGKIQELKSSARGFKAFKNYRTNILFHFGGLALTPFPHKTP
jgi:transposase